MKALLAILGLVVGGGLTYLKSLFEKNALKREVTKKEQEAQQAAAKAEAYKKAQEEEKKNHEETIANYKARIEALEKMQQADAHADGVVAGATDSDDSRLEFLQNNGEDS